LLSVGDQKKFIAITIAQIFMGLLDLIGVAAIGLLGALSITNVQSDEPGNRVTAVLEAIRLENLTFQTQAIVLGSAAVFLLVGRTILSIFLTRRILFFLSRRGAVISSTLIKRLLSRKLLDVQKRSTQEILYAVTSGVDQITLYVLAPLAVLVSDLSLLTIMAIGLLVVDPYVAIGTFLVFAILGVVLYKIMHVKAELLGKEQSVLSIKSNEKIVEVFASFRESVVRNRRDYYARNIESIRFSMAGVSAERAFMPFVSKYVIETSVIVGALLIGCVQFLLYDTAHAVATLSIFLASGSRIAPAVLRVQQSSVQIRGSLGQALPTLDLNDELGNSTLIENVGDQLITDHRDFQPLIILNNISLTYPGSQTAAISNIDLAIPAGKFVAFVGPSGAGKTTLIDVLLGVLNQDSGEVSISGLSPLNAVSRWPGAISYVPQDVAIISGTYRDNVAMGFPKNAFTDEMVLEALKVAQLEKLVNDLPIGIDTQVGEGGNMISGGQRQRLGIARAMFTQPKLLVLDEATSALDGETEAGISDSIQSLRGDATIIMIAHRLSTIMNADMVVYMEGGRIKATGSFVEVRRQIPNFDKQANLMGL
jgi:ABC-type multidrug transport system fused ATPase/permease subunit